MNMKAIDIKLATFSFAAMLLASCSDSGTSGEDSIIDPVGKATTIVGSNVTAEYADKLASRVTNYKVTTESTETKVSAAKHRAFITRAVSNEVPAGAKKLSSLYNERQTEHAAGDYYIDKDEVISGDWNICNLTIYIKDGGKFIYDKAYTYGNKPSTINVLEGGTLVCRNDREIVGDTKITNWGTIEFPKKDEYIIKNTFYNWKAENLDFSNVWLNLQGGEHNLYVNGNLKAGKISMIGNAELICNNVDCAGEFYMSGDINKNKNSYAVVQSTLKAASLRMDNASKLENGCSIQLTGDAELTNAVNVDVRYFKCKNLYQSAGCSLNIYDQSMVDCEGTYDNQNQGTSWIDLKDKNGVAVFKADKIVFNGGSPTSDGKMAMSLFRTPGDNAHIIVDAKHYGSGNHYYDVDYTGKITLDDGNVYLSNDSEAKKYKINKTECNPNGYNDDPANTEDQKKPSLDLISSIDYDNHDHDISATCIQAHNGRMYMSYHTRGKGSGACVEVFTPVENDKVTLEQYLYDEQKSLDFNHLLAVETNSKKRMVYLAGSSNKKGAMLAYIPIQNNHLLADKSKSITTTIEGKDTVIIEKPLQFIQLHPATAEYSNGKYDENCVVYNDKTNHLIVATTEGYIVYDADTYNEMDKISKPGKAKHLDIGNGKIVALYLDKPASSNDEAIPATIEVFDQGDEDHGEDLRNPVARFSVSTIQPNNGKNVVQMKDNKIYVCRGAAGMYVYDMKGNELWHYQMPSPTITTGDKKDQYKAYANGCYVGNKYVYIAYGSFGLVVLDKDTHKVVAHKIVDKSANYVIEYKGYIYVAYGKSRMQVFKLNETGAKVSY